MIPSRDVSEVLTISVDINANLDDPIVVVGRQMTDGLHILNVFHGDEAEDLYDYLLGEGEY